MPAPPGAPEVGSGPGGALVLCNDPALAVRMATQGARFETPEAFLPPDDVGRRIDAAARDIATLEHGPSTVVDGVPLERLFPFALYSLVVEAYRCRYVAAAALERAKPRRVVLRTRLMERAPALDSTFPPFMYLPDWLSSLGREAGCDVEVVAPQGVGPPPRPEPAAARRFRLRGASIAKAVARAVRRRKVVAFYNMFKDYATARAVVRELNRGGRDMFAVQMNEGVPLPVAIPHGMHLDPSALLTQDEARAVAKDAAEARPKVESALRAHIGRTFPTEGIGFDVEGVLRREVAALAASVEVLLPSARAASRALELLRPRLCFIRADWTPLERAFTLVARASGARVVVLQHGATSEWSYNGFAASPTVADYQFCWGEIPRAQQLAWGVPPDRVIVTGSPKYEALAGGQWREGREAARLVAAERERTGARTVVLYMSQPYTCQSALDDTQERTRVAEELVATLGAKKDVLLVIKPHPVEDIALYDALIARHASGNVVVLKGSSYDFIQASDVVVTHSSGTGIESVLLGKPTMQVLATRRKPQVPLAELGAAMPITSREDYERVHAQYLSKGMAAEIARRHDRTEFLDRYMNGSDGRAAANVLDAASSIIDGAGPAAGGRA